jgi:hypothetical protein
MEVAGGAECRRGGAVSGNHAKPANSGCADHRLRCRVAGIRSGVSQGRQYRQLRIRPRHVEAPIQCPTCMVIKPSPHSTDEDGRYHEIVQQIGTTEQPTRMIQPTIRCLRRPSPWFTSVRDGVEQFAIMSSQFHNRRCTRRRCKVDRQRGRQRRIQMHPMQQPPSRPIVPYLAYP